MTTATFAFSYTRVIRPLLTMLGMGPRASAVVIGPEEVEARMGRAFRAHMPTSAVQSVEHDDAAVLGWGAHGWRGRWLVNGSSRGMIRLAIDPPAQARMLGFPIRLSVLRLSLVDPDGLLAAVGAAIARR